MEVLSLYLGFFLIYYIVFFTYLIYAIIVEEWFCKNYLLILYNKLKDKIPKWCAEIKKFFKEKISKQCIIIKKNMVSWCNKIKGKMKKKYNLLYNETYDEPTNAVPSDV